jgi:hypothetical protein
MSVPYKTYDIRWYKNSKRTHQAIVTGNMDMYNAVTKWEHEHDFIRIKEIKNHDDEAA